MTGRSGLWVQHDLDRTCNLTDTAQHRRLDLVCVTEQVAVAIALDVTSLEAVAVLIHAITNMLGRSRVRSRHCVIAIVTHRSEVRSGTPQALGTRCSVAIAVGVIVEMHRVDCVYVDRLVAIVVEPIAYFGCRGVNGWIVIATVGPVERIAADGSAAWNRHTRRVSETVTIAVGVERPVRRLFVDDSVTVVVNLIAELDQRGCGSRIIRLTVP